MKRSALFVCLTVLVARAENGPSLRSIISCAAAQGQPAQEQSSPEKPKVDVASGFKMVHIGEEINFQEIMLNLRNVAHENEVQGVLLVIDNYGGRTSNFFMVHDLIKKISTLKPVVALVSGAALSGGYAIASAANYIVAGDFSELGSIGVILEAFRYVDPHVAGNVDAQLEVQVFQAGEFKGVCHRYKTMTNTERAYIREQINTIYKQFIATVARNRSLKIDDYKTWAEGKIFLAPEALKLGLIDQIGTVLEAENKLLDLMRKKKNVQSPISLKC